MSKPESADRKSGKVTRHFLSRAEVATLLGMVLVVFSLFFNWESRIVSPPGALPFPTLYGGAPEITVQGMATTVRLPLICCALLCGSLLLAPESQKARMPTALVQGTCAILCLAIALNRLAFLPGVILGLLGGTLLLFGAIGRYQSPNESG